MSISNCRLTDKLWLRLGLIIVGIGIEIILLGSVKCPTYLLVILPIVLSLITVVMLFKKRKNMTFLAFRNEFKPKAANIILTIILFGLTLYLSIGGFPLKIVDICIDIGIVSSPNACPPNTNQCLCGNFILDLLFWYVISCIFVFIYRPINKKDQ
jgi:hypothetical protein